jgi:hypothetical protein
MGAAAGGMSVLAAGLTAFGDVEKGAGQQAADSMQAAELRTRAEYAGAAAAETGATLTDRLATTLGNIDVVRAAAHTDPSSPTTLALRSRATEVGNQQKAIRVGNILAQQSEDIASANYLASAGTFAMDMGYLSAATDVVGGISKTNPNLFGTGNAPAPSVSDQAIY